MPANSSRVYLERFVMRAAASVPTGARVLDAGAGECPYRRHFRHARYEAADFCQVDKAYAPVDYVCDLRSVPVEDGRYDLVLLTQVLEHLPEPVEVLRELHRVLKPGGNLWLTTPVFYEEHEQPYDFYRFTQYGLSHLLQSAGLEVKEIEWLEGYYGTLSYQLRNAGRHLPVRAADYGGGPLGAAAGASMVLVRQALRILAFTFTLLDLRHKYVTGGNPKNYCVVAQKQAAPPAIR